MRLQRSKISEDTESETDLDNGSESSPDTDKKSSRPGGPFSFEPMIANSEKLTDSGDSTAVR